MKKFVITIGRQFGSGGRDVGKRLAEIFDIAYYDKKLITEASRRSGLSDEAIEGRDEKYPNALWHALSAGFPFNNAFKPEDFFTIQSDTIRAIARKESCVIVGRSADYVLRENPDCINIFLHAPLKDRAAHIASRENISKKDAQELAEKVDKGRAAYYNFYTDKQWGDSKSYHLSVDTSVLGMDATADYIADFVRKALELGR